MLLFFIFNSIIYIFIIIIYAILFYFLFYFAFIDLFCVFTSMNITRVTTIENILGEIFRKFIRYNNFNFYFRHDFERINKILKTPQTTLLFY